MPIQKKITAFGDYTPAVASCQGIMQDFDDAATAAGVQVTAVAKQLKDELDQENRSQEEASDRLKSAKDIQSHIRVDTEQQARLLDRLADSAEQLTGRKLQVLTDTFVNMQIRVARAEEQTRATKRELKKAQADLAEARRELKDARETAKAEAKQEAEALAKTLVRNSLDEFTKVAHERHTEAIAGDRQWLKEQLKELREQHRQTLSKVSALQFEVDLSPLQRYIGQFSEEQRTVASVLETVESHTKRLDEVPGKVDLDKHEESLKAKVDEAMDGLMTKVSSLQVSTRESRSTSEMPLMGRSDQGGMETLEEALSALGQTVLKENRTSKEIIRLKALPHKWETAFNWLKTTLSRDGMEFPTEQGTPEADARRIYECVRQLGPYRESRKAWIDVAFKNVASECPWKEWEGPHTSKDFSALDARLLALCEKQGLKLADEIKELREREQKLRSTVEEYSGLREAAAAAIAALNNQTSGSGQE